MIGLFMTLSRIRKCNFFFKLSKAYRVKFIENIKKKNMNKKMVRFFFFLFFLCKKTLRRYFFPIFNNKRQNWKHVRGYYIIGRLNNQGIFFFGMKAFLLYSLRNLIFMNESIFILFLAKSLYLF